MNWHDGHIGIGEYRREVVFDANGGQVATIIMPGEVGETHARLIAAAPTMLEALKACVAPYDDDARRIQAAREGHYIVSYHPEGPEIAQARAAIALAQGRQP